QNQKINRLFKLERRKKVRPQAGPVLGEKGKPESPLNLLRHLPRLIDVSNSELDIGHGVAKLKKLLCFGQPHENQGRIDLAHAGSEYPCDEETSHFGNHANRRRAS